jgi:hypothetical protein
MESVSQAVPSEAQWRLEWIAKDSTDSHAVCQYIGGSSSPPRESELPAPGSAAENFDGSSLDLLALHFTTVKVMRLLEMDECVQLTHTILFPFIVVPHTDAVLMWCSCSDPKPYPVD